MHELIGHVQSQQAVQRSPHNMGDLAGISRKNPLINASLNEFYGVLEQAPTGCQELGITLRRRLGSRKDQGVLDRIPEHEVPVRIEDGKHLRKGALRASLALAHELLEPLEAQHSDIGQKIFLVLEISIRQRVTHADRIGESPKRDSLQPARAENRQGSLAEAIAHRVDFCRT